MMEALEKLKALCDAATPGPWYAVRSDDRHFATTVYISTVQDDALPRPDECYEDIVAITLYQDDPVACHSSMLWRENANFIAAARTALPALIELCEGYKKVFDHHNLTPEETATVDAAQQKLESAVNSFSCLAPRHLWNILLTSDGTGD